MSNPNRNYNWQSALTRAFGKLRSSAQKGYGMALLLVFVASTILVGASMSLILAPSSVGYLGAMSIDGSSARQVALVGLDAAQSDMMTQMATGTTITTSYRYPSSGTNTVSMPTYPSSGSSASVGTYYVTVTKARGYTYMLQSTATVNSNVITLYKLVQMNDSLTPTAFAAYSLRKAISTYTGYAVNVRCASTSTTQDIGFDGSGNFDVATLRTCLGDSTLPLDVTTGGKLAYGLRKLRSAYSGYAIKVRRSSDNATQDIGFDANGNLDTTSLLSFVGTGSGYIDTWYDQSTSGKNATQATTSRQPRIVNSGVLDTVNNAPAAYFDDDSMSNTALGGTLITGAEIRAFIVSTKESGGSEPNWGQFAALHKTGDGNAYQYATSMEVLGMAGSPTGTATTLNNGGVDGSGITAGVLYQHTSYHNASNVLILYRNGSGLMSSAGVSANLAPNSIIIGTGAGTDSTSYIKGYIAELIFFNSAVSNANQQAIERSQGHYYNITGMADGFVTTWYDQSGNGRNLTQATTSAQPTISITSLRPSLFFDGTASYIENTAQSTTTDKITGFTVAQISNTGTVPSDGRIMSLGKTGDSNDWGQTSSTALFLKLNTQLSNARNNDLKIGTGLNFARDFQGTIIFDGTNRTIREKQGSNYSATTTTTGSGNLVINKMRAGYSFDSGGSGQYWKGKIYELIMYSTNLGTTDYQTVETDEQTYFGI